MPNKRTQQQSSRRAHAPALGMALVAAVAAASLVVACGESTANLLTVVNPNAVSSNIYQNPAEATLMVNSVIGDFECAYGGFVEAEGLLTDELHDATLANQGWYTDRRDEDYTTSSIGCTNGCTATQGSVYTPLSTARQEADRALNSLSGWPTAQVPTLSSLTAQTNLYAGFSYATLGMAMCQAAFDLGPLVSQSGMFALAEARFTSAIAAAQAAGLTSVLSAAYVGRARVRLYQHNTAGAIADAQLVPAGFVLNAGADATNARRYSHIYNSVAQGGVATVELVSRALTTENGQLDPRAAVIKLNTASADAGLNQIYIPTKYNAASLNAGLALPIPIARYAEAQLILAEAQGGAAAVTIINAMRAAVPLQPYVGLTDATSIKNLIAGERQRALFVEGFRAFDVERLNLPLVPAVGSPYLQGGTYGGTVCFPLQQIETGNNPNIDQTKIITGVQGQFPLP